MNIEQFKREVKGKFFSVTFIKKDGTLREMTARLGVKKHLRGGPSKDLGVNMLTVFDVQKKAYRTVNFEQLISLRYNGKMITNKDALLKVMQWNLF